MRTFTLRLIVLVIASAALTACTSFELIRSRSPGPSPSTDHCPVCMDIGQAWALFCMGAYDQADDTCTLVIEEEANANSNHTRRARDIGFLSRGYLALHSRDYPTAWALFREISDPQLRELGKPYVDSEGWKLAREARARTSLDHLPESETAPAACVFPGALARAPSSDGPRPSGSGSRP